MLKKSLLLGAVALGLSFGVAAKEWKEIRVAIDPTYKPFTYKTDDGKPTGFDVDIAQALCDLNKVKCVPIVGSIASGFSLIIIFSRISNVIGSI